MFCSFDDLVHEDAWILEKIIKELKLLAVLQVRSIGLHYLL